MAANDGSDFSKKDAAILTDANLKAVSRAWHDARDAAQALGELPERAAGKARDALHAHGIKHARDKLYVLDRQLVIHNGQLFELERQNADLYHTIMNRLRVVLGVRSVLILPE